MRNHILVEESNRSYYFRELFEHMSHPQAKSAVKRATKKKFVVESRELHNAFFPLGAPNGLSLIFCEKQNLNLVSSDIGMESKDPLN